MNWVIDSEFSKFLVNQKTHFWNCKIENLFLQNSSFLLHDSEINKDLSCLNS